MQLEGWWGTAVPHQPSNCTVTKRDWHRTRCCKYTGVLLRMGARVPETCRGAYLLKKKYCALSWNLKLIINIMNKLHWLNFCHFVSTYPITGLLLKKKKWIWVSHRTGTNSLTHDSHKQVTECEIWVSHGSIKVTVFWDMTLCGATATSLTVDQTTQLHTSTYSNSCQHKFPVSL